MTRRSLQSYPWYKAFLKKTVPEIDGPVTAVTHLGSDLYVICEKAIYVVHKGKEIRLTKSAHSGPAGGGGHLAKVGAVSPPASEES